MAFNAQGIRAMRQAKNNQARVNKYAGSNSGQVPFLETRHLLDGIYRFRPWPPHPEKNPAGYLYYRDHYIQDEPTLGWQCPRSNNWDPLPQYWEDENGNAVDYTIVSKWLEDPEAFNRQAGQEMSFFPVYTERCWGCEVEDQITNLGLELANLDPRLQQFILGTPGEYGPKSNGLIGGESYNFPVTFTAKVHLEEKTKVGDKEYINRTLAPSPTDRYHCILKLKEGKLAQELLRLIEEVPDCSNLMMGRWFRLEKTNGGQGTGGYKLSIEPNPTPTGFDLPNNYPNFSNWGKGNPGRGKPSKRLTYSQVEAIGANPNKWWVPMLTELGVQLSDKYDTPFY